MNILRWLISWTDGEAGVYPDKTLGLTSIIQTRGKGVNSTITTTLGVESEL